MTGSGPEAEARTLVPGRARGEALVLDEPLSFWGGVDPETGLVIDRRHPQAGRSVSRSVLVMPSGRGSSSSSSVLAEAVRAGTAPAAILLREADPILVVGALVAAELYGQAIPVVVLPGPRYSGVADGDLVEVEAPPPATGRAADIRVVPAASRAPSPPGASRSTGRT